VSMLKVGAKATIPEESHACINLALVRGTYLISWTFASFYDFVHR